MENLGLGLQISLTGVLIVACALAMIPVVVKISQFLVELYEQKLASKVEDKIEQAEIETEITEEKREESTDLEELAAQEGLSSAKVAAITAAISTYLATDKSYVIKSIKPAADNWKLSGRQKLLSNRLQTIKRSRKQERIYT
ncbi:hypothetical protein [Fuchsiella alkaliacetigena]|uniref:hypothetical protein n=1 Tax=Fuchsiella alkaliacetigena TaxID=957042 RepID=UPI00200A207B|nr:hypothetical protein [Fuchsiella alkaliacetigena]MCK8825479.1 hypothetical protein [Fuchsiella alkaliacetigena]